MVLTRTEQCIKALEHGFEGLLAKQQKYGRTQ
jgi:hypothetical protein